MKKKTKEANYLHWVILLTLTILSLSFIPGNVLNKIYGVSLRIISSTIHIERIIEYFNDPTTLIFLNHFDWSKLGHVIGYSAYGFALYQLCHCKSQRGLTLLAICILIISCLDEFIQSFTFDRSSAISDVILDTSAALLAIQVIILTKLHRQ